MGHKRYPINVQAEMRRENQTKADKKQALVYACCFGVIGGAVAIYMLLKMFFNISFLLSILISIVLALLVFLFVFKNFIFKEDEQEKKLQKQNSETFARFYSLGHDVAERIVLPSKREIPVFEYKDGNIAFVVEFKFGSNRTGTTITNSYRCLKSIFNLILRAGFMCNIIVSPEQFSGSHEYRAYINKVTTSDVDNIYKHTMLKFMKSMLTISEGGTGTSTIALIVRTKRTYQKYAIGDLLHALLDSIFSHKTGFRNVEFLDGAKFRDFMTRFYGLGAIDLSKYESSELDISLREKYNRLVKVYSKTGADNKTIRYDVFGNTFNNSAREVR